MKPKQAVIKRRKVKRQILRPVKMRWRQHLRGMRHAYNTHRKLSVWHGAVRLHHLCGMQPHSAANRGWMWCGEHWRKHAPRTLLLAAVPSGMAQQHSEGRTMSIESPNRGCTQCGKIFRTTHRDAKYIGKRWFCGMPCFHHFNQRKENHHASVRLTSDGFLRQSPDGLYDKGWGAHRSAVHLRRLHLRHAGATVRAHRAQGGRPGRGVRHPSGAHVGGCLPPRTLRGRWLQVPADALWLSYAERWRQHRNVDTMGLLGFPSAYRDWAAYLNGWKLAWERETNAEQHLAPVTGCFFLCYYVNMLWCITFIKNNEYCDVCPSDTECHVQETIEAESKTEAVMALHRSFNFMKVRDSKIRGYDNQTCVPIVWSVDMIE